MRLPVQIVNGSHPTGMHSYNNNNNNNRLFLTFLTCFRDSDIYVALPSSRKGPVPGHVSRFPWKWDAS